jgi:hypothetical protein
MVDGSDVLALEGYHLLLWWIILAFSIELIWSLLSCYHLFQVRVIVLGARWEV